MLRRGIEWYEDAPGAAFEAARKKGQLVLVDLWAPWCHTCLSMQSVVLTSDALGAISKRFTWLAIDTEREQNAQLLEQLPVAVWPTLYVVDPSGPEILGRWLGAASPAQLVRFLAESERGWELAQRGSPPAEPSSEEAALERLVAGDALAADGRHAEAGREYAAALARAPADWRRRPEALVAAITALYKTRDYRACRALGGEKLGQTGQAASAIDFAAYALECASHGEPEEAAVLRAAVAARLAPLCEAGSPELTADDQADACHKLSIARTSLGLADAARSATLARLLVLERAAAGKPAEVAATHDWARTDALIELGRAPEALALALQRERELPTSYNPPHYAAKAYAALRRWDEGMAALERALALAYGPRRIGLLSLKADLLSGAGRREEALQTVRAQLAAYRALPAGQRQPNAEARVAGRLRAMTGEPPEPPHGDQERR